MDDPTLLKTMFYLLGAAEAGGRPTAPRAAAALEGTTPIQGRRVGVILSGGTSIWRRLARGFSTGDRFRVPGSAFVRSGFGVGVLAFVVALLCGPA